MKSRAKACLSVLFCILTLAVVVAGSCPAAAQAAQREFIYTANFADNTISGFSFNTANGKVTEIAGSPFATGVGPVSITHSPDGHFIYVGISAQFAGGPCGNSNGELISYSVNARTGALTQLDDVVLSGICSTGVAVDPTGNFVYAASFPLEGPKVGIIDGYQTSNGHLTPLPGSPFSSTVAVADGQNPAIEQMAITPDGKLLYASNPSDSRGILIFDRDSTTGALAFRTGLETGSSFSPIAVTPSGRFLLAVGDIFVGAGQPGLFEFAIAANGDLTAVSGSPFATPGNGFGIDVGVSPDGNFAGFMGNGGISTYREGAQGQLSLVPGSPFGGQSGAFVFDPTGQFVFTLGTAFRFNSATGVLTKLSEFTPGGGAQDITVVKPGRSRDEAGSHEHGRHHHDDDERDGRHHERDGD
jgi:6-phosphogluconolactonase (cycloisomerase 2 family)